MTSKNLTSEDVIFIHKILVKKFKIPAGHIKEGELETLLAKISGSLFSGKTFEIFEQAAMLFEGIIRLHIFVDGNKRTALASTWQFLNQNNYMFVIPLSGTNFTYKIAQNKTSNIDKIIAQITNWLDAHSAKIDDKFKIMGLLVLHILLPTSFMEFFSKIKMTKLSKYILHRYLINKDPEITDFMFTLYKKQFKFFKIPYGKSEKKIKEK